MLYSNVFYFFLLFFFCKKKKKAEIKSKIKNNSIAEILPLRISLIAIFFQKN